jgi:hypothetical protein
MADVEVHSWISFAQIIRLCLVRSILVSWLVPRPLSRFAPFGLPAGLYRFAVPGYGTGVEGSTAGMGAAGVRGFPVVLTSFVGRAGEVREVTRLLEGYRLVTVTGPGGVGKTRLAGEVAGRVAARFADGAWLAGLAPVRDPARVPAVVAVALGVREQAGVPAVQAVARVLARRQLLLVLDNCEHVIGAAAELCAGLLQACDDVRVLATSREPLRIGRGGVPAGAAAGARPERYRC